MENKNKKQNQSQQFYQWVLHFRPSVDVERSVWLDLIVYSVVAAADTPVYRIRTMIVLINKLKSSH